GTTRVGADLSIVSPRITGNAAAQTAITAIDDIGNYHPLVIQGGGSQAPGTSQAGAQLTLSARRLEIDSRIDLPAGSLSLRAQGNGAQDAIVLGDHAQLLLTGFEKSFAGVPASAPGGSLSLAAQMGGIRMATGAVLDVSGAAHGGDAGSLQVASGGPVSLGGTLRASAQPGYRQGSADLDLATLDDFSSLNSASMVQALRKRGACGCATAMSQSAPRTWCTHMTSPSPPMPASLI